MGDNAPEEISKQQLISETFYGGKNMNEPFANIRKKSTNFYNQELYTDDQFKLRQPQHGKKKIIRRLCEVYQVGTPITVDNNSDFFIGQVPGKPTYLSQIRLFPRWHYISLIEPKVINSRGFYHVVVWKDGKLTKQIIDDYIFYNEIQQSPQLHNSFEKEIWLSIILKVWAKLNGGYNEFQNCEPFEFIRIFTYPDWDIFNVNCEDTVNIISKLNNSQNNSQYSIALSKNNKLVGQYGFTPNCVSYLIVGYIQDYGQVYIKMKSFTYDYWNNKYSDIEKNSYHQNIKLNKNQFIIPLKQFQNIFYLIYSTMNKYQKQDNIFYKTYNINLDALQSHAKILAFDIKNNNNINSSIDLLNQSFVGISIYFPNIKYYDLKNTRLFQQKQPQTVIPKCKILIAKQLQNVNIDANLISSMKQKLLENQDGDFLCMKSPIQYEWIKSDYFQGYNTMKTFLLKLKTETVKIQYRAIINIVSRLPINISDPKMPQKQQEEFLKEVLNSKTRIQQKNIIYVNPIKKGSWISINGDFQTTGYGYIVLHAIKNSENRIEMTIDTKKIKQAGYCIKFYQNQFKQTISVQDGERRIIVLKNSHVQRNQQRIWPPSGIEIRRVSLMK